RSYRFFFFFSSRRRHTRWPRDWSSDVCSSDLDIRVEKLEDADPHRLITSAAKSRYRVEPGFIRQLVFRDSLDNVQQLLCDEALEFAEGLLLENHPYLVLFVGRALAENQLSNFFEQWLGWAQVSL